MIIMMITATKEMKQKEEEGDEGSKQKNQKEKKKGRMEKKGKEKKEKILMFVTQQAASDGRKTATIRNDLKETIEGNKLPTTRRAIKPNTQ